MNYMNEIPSQLIQHKQLSIVTCSPISWNATTFVSRTQENTVVGQLAIRVRPAFQYNHV